MSINGKYRILQSCYWMMINVGFGYTTFYLGEFGFSAGMIGALTAAYGLISAVLQPLLGRIADRSSRFGWKRLLLILSALCCCALVSLQFFRSGVMIAILFGLIAVLINCMMPMINTACFYYQNRGEKIDFGIARGLGSGAYAVMAMILGSMTVRLGLSAVPLAGVPVIAVLFLSTWFLPLERSGFMRKDAAKDSGFADKAQNMKESCAEDERGKVEKRADSCSAVTSEVQGGEDCCAAVERRAIEKGGDISSKAKTGKKNSAEENTGFLRKYPAFCMMILGSAILLSVHNLNGTFQIQMLERVGGDSSNLGVSLAIAATLEVPVMFLFTRIIKKIPESTLLVVSAIGYIGKSVILMLAGSVGMIYAAQLMQPFSYALYASANVYFTDRCMEEQDAATGQALMSMTTPIGSVAGNLLGGWLIDLSGVPLMLKFTSVLSLVSAAVVTTAVVMHRRELRRKTVS